MSVTTRSARSGALALAVLALILGLVGMPSPAGAVALAAPANPAPASGTFGDNPTLTWDRVTGATNYAVEVSATSDFATRVWSATTVNKAAVPTVNLPAGQLYWRVRAQAGATLGPWAQGSLLRSAYAVPTGLAPADGTSFPQPAQAARLSWDVMRAATGYTVQVADDAAFKFVTNTFTTQNNSVVVRQLLNKTYYWRARANYSTSISSDWTVGHTFVFGNLPKPVVLSPANGASVDEPILSWQPIPGAATYELQVSSDSTFASTLVSQKGIVATTFAPGQSFAKGTYYWRVRPFDSASHGPAWSDVDVWSFTRSYAAQPVLEYPANAATVSEPVFFQWTPAKLAESYTLQLSSSAGFGSIDQSCTTLHTTYVPTGAGDCWPSVGGTYYWRVIGSDGPAPLGDTGAQQTNEGSAQVRSFTYSPTRPVMTAPLSGSVQVPTFRWNAVYGAAQYKVTITGPTNLTYTTSTTSFTPRTALAVGSYKWQVQSIRRDGEVGPAYTTGEQPSFSVVAQSAAAATVPNPTVGNQNVGRFPTLTWSAVTSATSYRILVKTVAASTFTTLPDSYVYPAGDDSATTWAPGNYQWKVTAYNGATALQTSATLGTFTINALSAPAGQKASLSGTASTSNATSCVKALSSVCTDLRQTPVLSWTVDPEAVFYKVSLAKDSALTQPVSGYPMTVDAVRNLTPAEVVDGTYYWAVQACRTASDCTTAGAATHGFSKTVKPLQLLTPAAAATVDAPAVTLTWRDLEETNLDTSASVAADNAGVAATAEARQYRIQIANNSAFTTPLSDAVVNQTQYTAPSTLYAAGTYYWRVQATDASGVALPWSSARTFVKTIPLLSLNTPANGASVPGSVAFTWTAQSAVSAYDFELYKNASAPTKITTYRTSVPGYVPPAPVAFSSQPYAWRVRPIDAKGNVGRWTAMSTFTVTGAAPTQVAPADGVMLTAPADALFTWNTLAGAASYRFERRNADTLAVAQKVLTAAPAYAPTALIGTGNWQWRVVALDAAGQSLGASSWRAFKVDISGPKVKTYSPTGTVALSTNFKVTFSEQVSPLTTAMFTITASGGSNALAASVTLDSTKKVATLDPNASLVSGKKYVVRLTSGVTDVYGNPMTAFSWTVTGK